MVSERLRALREKLQRREKKTRAKRRASSRRVEREEPETASEKATVKGRQAKRKVSETGEQAKGAAADAKTLIATELGVSREEAGNVIEEGSGLIEAASDQLDRFDADGDGDTDLLQVLEAEDDAEGGDGGLGVDLGEGGGGADPFGPNDDVGTVGLDDGGDDETDPFGGFL